MASTLNRSLTELGVLLHLVDPTLPIGGFNHSNGLETFVQQGIVESKATLEDYLQTQLLQNWIYNDGAYLSLAFDAMETNNFDRLCELDWALSATKIARESREGSFKLGVRLLKIFIRYENHPLLTAYQQAISEKQVQGYFPIVFAMVAQAMGLTKADTLYAFYYNAAVGAITNGVKLIPLSQMDGQDILFALRQPLQQAVELSLNPDPDWLGAATLANDIRAMQHEQLYTRLYMS
ncbi:urease accessory protein UreF [Rodentibacter trehalosifermentans]|uniref:Urease accessory protein UreF n=1 Tax=Rodentibacter trehalosifermentans TaxID=1908263 RepID=A0A1V3ITK1_9PAST|nr:urease accessory protein UreF [Rodentibacter trehalosifermentans]OOF45575.1 urease accessory protein UreF [Rodentibacter trehalosifermentans]OOF46076.1 urease accessory protein UreF [Rodentibacter trehalosifermentans]OOF53078.1 urease accessory protein UreF [Rodentibacter trehalosifermentans]